MIHGTHSGKMAQLSGCRLLFFLYIICLLKISFISCDVTSDECMKESPCRCRFKSNNSIIDLDRVGSKDGPRFTGHALKGEKYYYNPCYDFKIKDGGECAKGEAACVQNGSIYTSLGSQSSSTFNYNQSTGQLSINYSSPIGQNNLTVYLSCTTEADSISDLGEINNTHQHVLTLYTKCACPNKCLKSVHYDSGLSTGSVLIILFFVALVVYFIGGMIFLRFVRGANGIEIIPHYEFWTDLPVLIRDGIFFTLNGCKPEASYDRI